MRATTRLAAAVLGLTLAAGCSTGGAADKAGGVEPVTLTVGTAEQSDSPVSGQLKEFVRLVDHRSHGALRLQAVWEAQDPPGDDWDQQALRRVVQGRLDAGVIPARSWDTEGVTSLRALQAPFLVTSDALVERVVTDPLAEDMLAGLERRGVVGLALLPEGLRHPFAYHRPLRGPDDYRGAAVRVPRSQVTHDLFEALGAFPDDYPGDAFGDAVDAGILDAAESTFAWSGNLHTPTIATGNVTFFPKVNVIAVNRAVWQGLTDGQRSTLRQAAAAARDWALANAPSDEQDAKTHCAAGGRVVHASPAQLAALERAVAPVYAFLERDARTKAFIQRIRTLKNSLPAADPPTPCGDG
ncbi:TRAP dicarboxylate transporter-DctP subunit [Streptomyces davaonensis JCM 4913]|uniref:TRAP dicarboxylate transporter-DctP subunit n=1 Tax=Streptomyces davaonensis (strain DSM 101723 / JCM 4913 / KCC S-0913 / 768) TaxID=1214101 RepID=K4QT26_STRDJ|nr:TRAP transporter substrate-binding protein DctP [Streptomyces davaonensis]CCK25666.1 TRAP dicarboxylate transporter-DctP subunit [Streptomyces davaonensis JCM 4913]